MEYMHDFLIAKTVIGEEKLNIDIPKLLNRESLNKLLRGKSSTIQMAKSKSLKRSELRVVATLKVDDGHAVIAIEDGLYLVSVNCKKWNAFNGSKSAIEFIRSLKTKTNLNHE